MSKKTIEMISIKDCIVGVVHKIVTVTVVCAVVTVIVFYPVM